MNLFKNQKIALRILMVFVAAIFLISPISLKAIDVVDTLNDATTGAGLIASIAMEEVLKTVNALLAIFLGAIGSLLVIMGKILGVVLSITLNPQFYTAGIVGTGFKVVLQVADMFFLLIMIVIGIATIVQYESYALKKLLPTIILIALLINFSLPISQFIIGFADDLAVFFFNSAFEGNLSKIGDLLIGQLGLSSFVVDGNTARDFCPSVLAGSLVGVMGIGISIGCRAVSRVADAVTGNAVLQQLMTTNSLILAILIFLITLIYLILGVVLFLTRTVMLWSLIIFAPLAWISGVLPHTAHYLSDWWKKFFTWAFFPFLFALFLYISLSIVTSQIFVDLTADFIDTIDLSSLNAAFGTFAALSLGPILGAITIFILFFGGLFMSLKLAGGAGEMVVKGTQTAKNWAIGATGKALKQRAGAPALGKIGQVAVKIPGLGALGRGAMLKAGAIQGERRGEYEKKYAGIGNLSPDQQKALVQSSLRNPVATGMEKATALSKLREVSPGQFKDIVEKDVSAKGYVQQHGTEKDKMEAIKATGDVTFKLTQDEAKDSKKVEDALKKAFASLTPDEAKKIKFDEMLKNKAPQEAKIISEAVLSQLNGDALAYMAKANPNSLKALAESSSKDLALTGDSKKDLKIRNEHFRKMLRPDVTRYVSTPAVQQQLGTSFETPEEKEYRERRKKIIEKKRAVEGQRREKKEVIKREEEAAMKQAERIAEAVKSALNSPPSPQSPPGNP